MWKELNRIKFTRWTKDDSRTDYVVRDYFRRVTYSLRRKITVFLWKDVLSGKRLPPSFLCFLISPCVVSSKWHRTRNSLKIINTFTRSREIKIKLPVKFTHVLYWCDSLSTESSRVIVFTNFRSRSFGLTFNSRKNDTWLVSRNHTEIKERTFCLYYHNG